MVFSHFSRLRHCEGVPFTSLRGCPFHVIARASVRSNLSVKLPRKRLLRRSL